MSVLEMTSYFYDNWLVNILLYLDEIKKLKKQWWNDNINAILNNFWNIEEVKIDLDEVKYEVVYKWKKVYLKLKSNKLEINLEDKDFEKFLEDIFKFVLYSAGIVYFTKNNEWKLDLQSNKLVYSPKVDIRWKGSGNDVLHPKKKFFKTFNEIADIKSIIKDFYDSLSEKEKNDFRNQKWAFKEIEKSWIKFWTDKKFKWIEIELENWKKVYVEKILTHFTLWEFLDSYVDYMLSNKENLKIDSKLNPFEDWQDKFEDLLKNKKKISKIDFLIWQIGQKWKMYYSGDYYFYFHSYNLIKLYWLKRILKIIDKLDDKNTNINLAFLKWYFFPPSEYFEILKFSVFLYKLLDDKNTILDFLFKDPTIIFYKNDAMKDTLLVYNKLNFLFKIFDEWNIKERENFKQLVNYINNVIKNYYWKLDNFVEFKKIWYNILNIKPFHLDLADIQNKNISLDKHKRQLLFGDFFDLYSKYLNMLWIDNNLHQISKEVGEKIGYFLAKSEKWWEDILFKLRNVKNKTQLLERLGQIMFLILREPDKQMRWTYEAIDNLLQIVKEENFEDIKAYLTIYSIEKYLRVKKATENEKTE